MDLLKTPERVEHASIIVTRNIERTAINNEFCRRFALLHKRPLFVSPAQDRFTGKHTMSDADRTALRKLPDSQTDSLPGLLPLCEGLPVVLKKTISPKLNLCNGSMGRIVRIVLGDSANTNFDLASGEPQFLWEPPVCVLVHFPDAESRVHLEGLPPGVVPIYPVETAQPFDFRIRTRAGTLVRRVKRMQIPLHPAKCLTTYGAQGLTLPAIIIDICKAPIARNHAQSMYVALSRVRSLYDLAFLRPTWASLPTWTVNCGA